MVCLCVVNVHNLQGSCAVPRGVHKDSYQTSTVQMRRGKNCHVLVMPARDANAEARGICLLRAQLTTTNPKLIRKTPDPSWSKALVSEDTARSGFVTIPRVLLPAGSASCSHVNHILVGQVGGHVKDTHYHVLLTCIFLPRAYLQFICCWMRALTKSLASPLLTIPGKSKRVRLVRFGSHSLTSMTGPANPGVALATLAGLFLTASSMAEGIC